MLSVFLLTGVFMTGWVLALHSHNIEKSAEFQNELKNDIQEENVILSALDHNKIILVLFCAGLIGFLGIRRQSKTLKNVVRVGHPESRAAQIYKMKLRQKGRLVPKR